MALGLCVRMGSCFSTPSPGPYPSWREHIYVGTHLMQRWGLPGDARCGCDGGLKACMKAEVRAVGFLGPGLGQDAQMK